MNLTKFTDFINQCKGEIMSSNETLAQLATTIEDDLVASQQGAIALNILCAHQETYDGTSQDADALTDEEYNVFYDIATSASNNNVVVNVVNGHRYILQIVKDAETNSISINNIVDQASTEVAFIEGTHHDFLMYESIIRSPDSIIDTQSYATLASAVSKGRALPAALASLARFMSSYGSDPSVTIIEGARNLLNQFKSLSGDTINTLISVVTGGSSALVDYIRQTYLQLKSAMESHPETYFSSTDIDIQTFSNGSIITATSAILSTVGTVLLGISRITGFLLMAIGSITGSIGQLVLKYVTNYNDTLFTWNGTDQAKCFKFVVAQDTISCPALASFMVSHNTTICSIRSMETASIIFCRLVQPELGVNSLVDIEEHLSVDFDISPMIHFIGEDGNNNPVWTFSDEDYIYLTFLKEYDNGSYTASPGHARFQMQPGKAGQPSTINNLSHTDFRMIGQTCYKPISLSLFDKFKDFYNDEITVSLYQRLMSALFLWSYPKFICSVNHANLGVGWRSIYFAYSDIDDHLTCRMPFGFACQYLYKALEYGYNQNDNVYRLPNTETTGFWNCIIGCFDGIPLTKDYDFQDPVPLCTCYECTEFDPTVVSGQTPVTITLNNLTASGTNMLLGMFSFAFCLPNLTPYNIYTAENLQRIILPDYTEMTYSSAWPTNLGVDCPKLTFNAFVQGLIIDGIIITGAIIVTIWAITGYMKLKTAARKAALNAEAATYAYTDARNSGASTEELNVLYKQQRRATIKSDLLNISTGGLQHSDSDGQSKIEGLLRQLKDIISKT